MGIQASPFCRLTMMVGITVLVLLGHLVIETEALTCSTQSLFPKQQFHLKPESAAMDYCEKIQKVIRKKNLDCDRFRERDVIRDPDVIVDCGAFFIPLDLYSSRLSTYVSRASCTMSRDIDDECDGIWKDMYQKVKVKITELEEILEEHKEHLDVVRKLAKKVAKLGKFHPLMSLKYQMFNLINFKDPEKGFTKVIKVINRLLEVEGENKEEDGKEEGDDKEDDNEEEGDDKEDNNEEEGSGLIVVEDDNDKDEVVDDREEGDDKEDDNEEEGSGLIVSDNEEEGSGLIASE